MSRDANVQKKRARAVAKIKEVAPHVESLIQLLDETKVDLILIALAGATLPAEA
ncbi:hypothetical protein [Mesorhizobium sp.]|uniref:hypothetical protein n=1 Tax=Mesorhizobium sp. TaxID=1871066 RepID=UPI0025C51578|nr:hypothetical protein [Mesorhizobium sp.]